MPCFHGHLPQEAAGVKPSRQEIYLTCSRADAARSRPASVRGDNNGCSKGLRSNSVTGSLAPRQNRSPCRPHPPYPFHPSGCAAQMETQCNLDVVLGGDRIPCTVAISQLIIAGHQSVTRREAAEEHDVEEPYPRDRSRRYGGCRRSHDCRTATPTSSAGPRAGSALR